MAVGVPKMEPAWLQKVEELSTRGISAQDLLSFYKELSTSMPHYDPSVHTTCDVVRGAIIPATKAKQCSYASLAT